MPVVGRTTAASVGSTFPTSGRNRGGILLTGTRSVTAVCSTGTGPDVNHSLLTGLLAIPCTAAEQPGRTHTGPRQQDSSEEQAKDSSGIGKHREAPFYRGDWTSMQVEFRKCRKSGTMVVGSCQGAEGWPGAAASPAGNPGRPWRMIREKSAAAAPDGRADGWIRAR